MRTNGRCDCGRRDCPCVRSDCKFGSIEHPDSSATSVCPECRPEVAAILAETAGDPDERARRLQARGVLKRRPRRRRVPTQRHDVYAEAHAEREAARADLR